MATYDLTTAVGQVRLWIPDTDLTAPELEDEEITFFLNQVGSNVMAAAVVACRWLARKYAQDPSFQADGLKISNGERAKLFAERAEQLAATLEGGYSSVTLTKTDGYAEAAADSDYGGAEVIYIRV